MLAWDSRSRGEGFFRETTFSYLKSDAQPGMSPTVAVSARMLLERCWEGRLRSSRGWIVHIIRLVPHGGQVIYMISVCRLHDHRGVRRWRVSMTFRSTKQTAHSIFYGRGQMCTTTATTAATTTFTGFVHHFVFDHFCSGYRCRYHLVATRLRYKHPNNVHLRCNITHFFFFFFPPQSFSTTNCLLHFL